MRVRVLGALAVEIEGGELAVLGGPKQRAVLAMLISAAGRPVSMDQLIEGVWGEAAPPSVHASIHSYVSNLRAGAGLVIERVGRTYRLDVDPADIDAVHFERLADDGRGLVTTHPLKAAETLRLALSLWRGRPYADLEEVIGLADEIRRLEELRLVAVEARIDADLANGRHHAVISELDALTAQFPLREGFRARHMVALYRDGRQAEALRAYTRTREVLIEELGVDPSPELRSLEARILAHDADLMRAADSVTERATFLFTDVVSSTAMWEAQPGHMRTAMARHDEILMKAIEEVGGRIVKHTGDGFLAVFPDVPGAASAAISSQRELLRTDWGPVGAMNVRMGIDTGEVEARAGDFFGPPVNRAARFMAAAHGGQILLTAAAQDALRREAGVQILNLGEHRFRGLGTPQETYQLVADELPADFPDLALDAPPNLSTRQFGDAIRGYELRERIGAGRFGVVYRAYQPSVGREVAVKVIRPEFANHPEFVRRFEGEARLVAKLEHPHIVSLYDFWRDHEGAYLVMPYLAGGSLADLATGTLDIGHVLPMLRQVAAGLSYAHRQGVIHRDIKPANILVDGDGNAYLGDFGVAIRAVELASGVRPTSEAYRAPEDEAGSPLDGRADVFSLGAVVRDLVVTGSTDRDAVADGVREVVDRAVSVRPNDRYASPDQFVAALVEATGGDGDHSTPTRVRNPYKGLAPFDLPDAADFHGRTPETRSLVELVGANRFVTVVGPSGSGKSSLVRAGLLPALARDAIPGSSRWLAVTAVPGRHPFDELATALAELAVEPLGDIAERLASDPRGLHQVAGELLAAVDGELVVVIDQFEELFTLVLDESVRRSFSKMLVDASSDPAGRVRIVTTIRADYFDRPLSDDLLAPLVTAANLAIGVPDPEQLLEAIVAPAAGANLRLDGAVATQLVADVRDQPGALPLMQFVLRDLVERSRNGRIGPLDYTDAGGVLGAIGRRATDVYEGLNLVERTAVEAIFLRLVAVSDEADDVRRRVLLTELHGLGLDRTAVDRVLDAYGDARLVTFDRDPVTRSPTVEVAHEALLREWPMFRAWLSDRRDALLVGRRLAGAMEEWAAAGWSDDLLPTGGRLAQFEEWVTDTAVAVSDGEREFVGAAVELRDRERRALARTRRAVLSGFGVAALIALALAIWANAQRADAVGSAEFARVREAEAITARLQADEQRLLATVRSAMLESEQLRDTDPELSALVAVEAVEILRGEAADVPARLVDALRMAMAEMQVVWRTFGGSNVSANPTGTLFVTAAEGGGVAVWDVASRSVADVIRGVDRFSAVDAIFTTNSDLLVLLADPDTGDLRGATYSMTRSEWSVGIGPIVDPDVVQFHLDWIPSTDGSHLAVDTLGGLEIWDLGSSELKYVLEDHTGGGVAFDGLGQIAYVAATGQGAPAVQVASVETGRAVATLGDLPFVPDFLAFSPDGDLLAASSQTAVGLIDVATAEVLWFDDAVDRSFHPVWLPDGLRFLLGGEGSLDIRSVSSGDSIGEIRATVGGTFSYAPLGDAGLIVIASLAAPETAVVDLSLSGRPEIGELEIPRSALQLDVGSAATTLHAMRRGSHDVVALENDVMEWSGGLGVGVTDSPPPMSESKTLIGAQDDDGIHRVRRTSDASMVFEAPPEWSIVGMSDVLEVVILSRDHVDESAVVDMVSGQVLARPDLGHAVSHVRFSPDQSLMLTNNNFAEAPFIRFWRTSDWAQVASFGSEQDGIGGYWSDFTPDAEGLAVGGYDGVLRIFDVNELVSGRAATESVRISIPAHGTFIVSVEISATGEFVVSSAWDEPARLWDLASGESQGEFGTSKPTGVAFHPSEPWLYTSEETVVRIHTLDLDELISIAEARFTRALTDEQCQIYFRQLCDA